ncbi:MULTISPECIES: S1C family serine protease [unclassified Sinorhizobium]|uniref:S1C family serine protease n=1 Tax=unclassified Sinorhizobium TaxID=2613772 RepID=UPI0035256739
MRRFYRYASISALATAAVLFGGIYSVAGEPQPPKATAAAAVLIKLESGHGSGVHIGNGFVLTASHVADGSKAFKLQTVDGKTKDAEVLWTNKQYDISLLRTDPAGLPAATLKCEYAHDGEAIQAVGNPLSLEFVSAFGRIAGGNRSLGPWKSVLVTDITTVPGQSGGGVFDADGNLIGITVGVLNAQVGLGVSLTGFGAIVPSQAICDLMGRVG